MPALVLLPSPIETDAAAPAQLAASHPLVSALMLGELTSAPRRNPDKPRARNTPKLESIADADQPPLDGPPPTATSLYMKTTAPRRLNRLGCIEGRHLRGKRAGGAIVVLAFGRPRTRGGHDGVSLFGQGFRSPKQVRLGAQAYAAGYVRCSRRVAPLLTVAIGTSNYGPKVGFAHGASWGRMVNDANDWLREQGLTERVAFAGANDIEMGWAGPRATRAWVRGYQSVARYHYYDYGDAGGCPPAGDSCFGAWTMEDLWYVSWGARLALPLPEIYTPTGSQARQWAHLSLYSFRRHGSRMHFAGALSQHNACAQSADPCWGMNNPPRRAWRQLHDLLNGDHRTAQRLAWLSDISWTEP